MLIEYPSGKKRKASKTQARLLEKLGKARIVTNDEGAPPQAVAHDENEQPSDVIDAEPQPVENLRDVAKSLGLKVPPRIGAEKLQAMIEGAK